MSVLLPEPDGPIMAMNSPLAMVRLMFLRAMVGSSRSVNVMPISLSSITFISIIVSGEYTLRDKALVLQSLVCMVETRFDRYNVSVAACPRIWRGRIVA